MRFPSCVEISKDACAKTGEIINQLRLQGKAAVFCPAQISEIGNKVLSSVENEYDIFEPSSIEESDLRKTAEIVKGYDFAIGIGGGKAIDIAKYSSYLAGKPWIAIPTSLSNDSIASGRASLSNEGRKITVPASEPAAIIIDIDIISKAPYRFIASGAGDALSKLSAIEDWRIADADGKEKMHSVISSLSIVAAEAVIKHAEQIRNQDERGMEILSWALICSGFAMNMMGSSRPGSGSEHNFSHALDEMGTTALHGEQVAIGTIIMQYLQRKDWMHVKKIMEQLGLPTKLSEIGIDKKKAIKALVDARNVRDRYTILNKVDINEEKAEEILKHVDVI